MSMLKQATTVDINAMHRVRLAVHENKLTTTILSEEDYVAAIETTGRGWVIESEGLVVAFVIGNRDTGSIWALFVHPDHEGRGYGRQLHDSAVDWLWSQGFERLWLNTEPGTRAQRFYESRGWERVGYNKHGEIHFELARPNKTLGAGGPKRTFLGRS